MRLSFMADKYESWNREDLLQRIRSQEELLQRIRSHDDELLQRMQSQDELLQRIRSLEELLMKCENKAYDYRNRLIDKQEEVDAWKARYWTCERDYKLLKEQS
jgi:hypothetical protein